MLLFGQLSQGSTPERGVPQQFSRMTSVVVVVEEK